LCSIVLKSKNKVFLVCHLNTMVSVYYAFLNIFGLRKRPLLNPLFIWLKKKLDGRVSGNSLCTKELG
ncbi:hypothetical protein, partial [Desulfobacter latus]|uniref:hypothetical protein n=1 Tax=Desulfobacter latus TaxID=2292 RepID=UPI001C497FA9